MTYNVLYGRCPRLRWERASNVSEATLLHFVPMYLVYSSCEQYKTSALQASQQQPLLSSSKAGVSRLATTPVVARTSLRPTANQEGHEEPPSTFCEPIPTKACSDFFNSTRPRQGNERSKPERHAVRPTLKTHSLYADILLQPSEKRNYEGQLAGIL